MPMKLYDTQDAVPEALRASAIETKDGKFAVDEVDPALGDAGKKALQDERDARKREADARKAAEKERDELKRANEAAENGVTREALDKINKDAESKFANDLKERDDLKAENRKLKLNDQLIKQWMDHGGYGGDRTEDALNALLKRADLDDAGKIIYKDKDGNVTADAPETFFPKFAVEKSWLFKGAGGSGSGADASAGNGGGGFDPVAAGKAAAAAQKQGREQNALAFK